MLAILTHLRKELSLNFLTSNLIPRQYQLLLCLRTVLFVTFNYNIHHKWPLESTIYSHCISRNNLLSCCFFYASTSSWSILIDCYESEGFIHLLLLREKRKRKRKFTIPFLLATYKNRRKKIHDFLRTRTNRITLASRKYVARNVTDSN